MRDEFYLKEMFPPPEDIFIKIPQQNSRAWVTALETGKSLCERGEVAVLILNGGMATRFSGVVKGVDVEVFGKPFLYWKLKQVKKVAPRIPVFIMTSPFTHEKTVEYLKSPGEEGEGIFIFMQNAYPTTNEDGSPFLNEDGKFRTAGRGHGDILLSFRESGMLDKFKQMGCRVLMVSNVDNLGAMLDPLILGMHFGAKKSVTIEVTNRKESYVGGIVAIVDGKPMIIEKFIPEDDSEIDSYRYFNTNTFYFNTEVLDSTIDLPLHRVVKEVRGRKVIQYEKILCEISHYVSSSFLIVPDEGRESRFIPVKTPAQLDSSLELMKMVLERWDLF